MSTGSTDQPTVDADTARLHELGYAQELRRGLGTFSNFAISFSIISVLAGAITTFWLGMVVGGWWTLSANRHFTGPRTMGSIEEILSIEAELVAEEQQMEAHHTLRPPGHDHD